MLSGWMSPIKKFDNNILRIQFADIITFRAIRGKTYASNRSNEIKINKKRNQPKHTIVVAMEPMAPVTLPHTAADTPVYSPVKPRSRKMFRAEEIQSS